MNLADTLPVLLMMAWLLPLASFVAILFVGPRMGKAGSAAGHVATGAILGSLVLSLICLFGWLQNYGAGPPVHAAAGHPVEKHAADLPEQTASPITLVAVEPAHAAVGGEHAKHAPHKKAAYGGNWYALGVFGDLRLEIGYYIDALTVCMFVMVSLIATCIHFYAMGYMHDELHDVTDHEVRLANGKHLHRPGRYHRFFQYLSLFCFSMFGIVIAGNIAMVFVFWELVGICSYFLIGFYYERHSASTAANKAFIVNRIGDFGMIIGMMALWNALGTFNFGDVKETNAAGQVSTRAGLFSLIRPASAEHRLTVPDGMVKDAAFDQIHQGVIPTPSQIQDWRSQKYGYGLLIVAGLGIFCGCVGKSAQFPLHVWLPDAMEGPTPVSALVHSATMVAAGVYLVGRFYPVFAPEVLLVIACIGGITLFIAATIAITATDIKRVLAYSTVSQLGYMMLALGLGGWLAGVFHLITHAFFKSLLFMCSGSVIHACHTNEMPKMGGLRHKMPWTAGTMLIGCMAIAGAGIPLIDLGMSGYYSKDAIIMQAMAFRDANAFYGLFLFILPTAGAAITAFYMFRLWYMTFAGQPRDHHIYDHAHESPKIMYVPLVILAVFAVGVAWRVPLTPWELTGLLEQARPEMASDTGLYFSVVIPSEHDAHAFHTIASLVAFSTAALGFVLATLFYGVGALNPDEVRRQFQGAYQFLRDKWRFDELYHVMFVRPVHVVSAFFADFDRDVIDRALNFLAQGTVAVARIDDRFDRTYIDGFFDKIADGVFTIGLALRAVQTGRLRQYVVFIAVGTVGIFVLISLLLGYAAG